MSVFSYTTHPPFTKQPLVKLSPRKEFSKRATKRGPFRSLPEFVMSSHKALGNNWPVDHRERCKAMFNNELLSDVKFVVQASQKHGEPDSKRSKMEIPAHKFLLSICSPVFFAMFCGEMAETKEHIDLPDCEYEGMLELLRFIYTDEVCLNGDNVMQVLYLAEKYMIPNLTSKCTEYLQRNLDLSNVLCVFKHAEQFDNKDLLSHCWDLIDKDTEKVLKPDEFLSMDKSFLEQLVIRDSLNIREVELFKAVDRWAEEECKRRQLRTNGSVKRRVLGEQIVKNLRFPIMDAGEFRDVALPSKILTQKETTKIIEYFSSTLTSPVGFLNVPRVSSLLRCCKFKGFTTRGRNNPYRDDYCALRVDKDIMLHGVSLLGSDGGRFIATVQVKDWGDVVDDDDDSDTVATVKNRTFTSRRMECDNGFYYGFDVLFDNPVLIKKDCTYFVDAEVDGPVYYYGTEAVNEECSGVTFRFSDSWNIVYSVHGRIDASLCAGLLFKVVE